MKKLIGIMALSVAVVGSIVDPAGASGRSGGTFSDGPYASTGPDSGTCGNNWALDLFNRSFVATLPGVNGTYSVTETFSKGTFLTIAGQSPAACDTGYVQHGATVKEGISGKFSGTFTITVTDGVFNEQGSCERDPDSGQCTTAGWIHGFFGDQASYSVGQFSFSYTAKKQGLIYTHWVNADTGNSGDIASA